jgi:hypothetical protein
VFGVNAAMGILEKENGHNNKSQVPVPVMY